MVEIGRTYTKAYLSAQLAAKDTALSAHIDDTSAAHAASAISFSPTGSISSTSVQAAIAELLSEMPSANQTIEVFNVKAYGAVGTGSGGASADQTGFSLAFSAANASTTGGIVYAPPGDYYVTGPFTQDPDVLLMGAGVGRTVIHHTGNNTFITSTAQEFFKKRGWIGFTLHGNSGASANGLVFGDTYGAILEDLLIWDYTSGSNIEVRNTTYWTEGTQFFGVVSRGGLRNLSFRVIPASPTNDQKSFAETRIHGMVVVQENAPGAIGVSVGANCRIYGSTLDFKCHNAISSAKAINLEASTSTIEKSHARILIEDWQSTPGAAVVVPAGGYFVARGVVDIDGNCVHDINSTGRFIVTGMAIVSENTRNNNDPVDRFPQEGLSLMLRGDGAGGFPDTWGTLQTMRLANTANFSRQFFYPAGSAVVYQRTANSASKTVWKASTAYTVGSQIMPTSSNENGFYYQVTVAGTSGASEPAWPTTITNTVTANGVTYRCEGTFWSAWATGL